MDQNTNTMWFWLRYRDPADECFAVTGDEKSLEEIMDALVMCDDYVFRFEKETSFKNSSPV